MYDVRILSLKSIEEVKREMAKIGVDTDCVDSLALKSKFIVFKISHIRSAACNIIKQSALSVGTDAAVHRDVITGMKENSSLLLFGSLKEIERVAVKLKGQAFGLNEISERLMQRVSRDGKRRTLKTARRQIELGEKVYIMGVLNVTPDSFSDGGAFAEKEKAVERAFEMVEQGADIIDIGGESTRPGSERISETEELERVIPVISELVGKISVPVSIDTYKSVVASQAIRNGAEIVNDISGLRFDEGMKKVIAETNAGIIIMHMLGNPRNMQKEPSYKDTVQEIYDFLKQRTEYAMSAGIEKERIIVDPGIGFGKRVSDNFEILDRCGEFKSLEFPILIGASRKSFIGKTLGLPVKERLSGSLASCAVAIEEGVDILRVHDVYETRKFVDMYENIRERKV